MIIDRPIIDFYKKSLMLSGDLHIDKITTDFVLEICRGKLDCLNIMRRAFEELLAEYHSKNGVIILNEINNEILKLRG